MTTHNENAWREFQADDDAPEAEPPKTETASSGGAEPSATRWPAPLALPKHVLRSVRPYTPEMVPSTLRPWLTDVAERGNFCFDYLAVAAVTGLGAAIGSKCAVYPKRFDSWHEVPNVWGAIVGRPSMMKSPSMGAALAPLHRIAHQWQADHATAVEQFETAQKKAAFIAKVRHKNAESAAKKAIAAGRDFDLPDDKADDSPPPPARRLITSDATKEKLGDLLVYNPAGIFLEMDELTALNEAISDDPGLGEFLLKAWNGKFPHHIDRMARGELYVPRACVSVFGGIQPGRIAPHVRRALAGGAGSDGKLARYQLVAFPDGFTDDWKVVDRAPNRDAQDVANHVYSMLANADENQFPNADPHGLPGLRFEDNAQERFFEWWEALQTRLRSNTEPDAIAEVLGKWPKLVPSLALIFELAEDPTARAISLESLEMAIRWGDVAETHQRRLYDTANADLEAAQRIMARVRAGDLDRDGFSAREIMQKNWRGLSDKSAVLDAIALLEDYGWLVPQSFTPGRKGGRPTVIYLPNPLADGMPLDGSPGGF